MCGICGIALTDNRRVDFPEIDPMVKALQRRGPDQEGTYVIPGIAFGHRRLSIIDLKGSPQPLISHDKKIAIVYNGEVYNFRQLRSELEKTGVRFRTTGDTEVVMESYRAFGSDCAVRLNGMFSFVICDTRGPVPRLYCARDRLGQKPFYYIHKREAFTFASQISSLLLSGISDRRLDHAALPLLLHFGFIPDPDSLIADVKQLPPGHFAVWERGRLDIQRYWDLPSIADHECSPKHVLNLVNELDSRLSSAVASHLVADVPVGVLLSGGLDSSALVVQLDRIKAANIRAFTVRFGHARFDESEVASAVAKHYGIAHTIVDMPQISFSVSDFEIMLTQFGQPFGDTSSIACFYLFREIGSQLKAVLSGDGGDEMLGGYKGFSKGHLIDKMRHVPAWIRQTMLRLPWPTVFARYHRIVSSSMVPHEQFLADLYATASGRSGRILVNRAIDSPRVAAQAIQERMPEADSAFSCLDQHMRLQTRTMLPGDILRKVDRTSMAFGVEVRPPFLDNDMVDFCMKLPSTMKVSSRESKILLRRLLSGKLPSEAANHQKHGFGVPLREYINESFYTHAADSLASVPHMDEIVDLKQLGNSMASARMMQRNGAPWTQVEPCLTSLWLQAQLVTWVKLFDIGI